MYGQRKKRCLSFLLTIALLTALLGALPVHADGEREQYVSVLSAAGFPESYLEPLWQLHGQYPAWSFAPMRTGMSWQDAVAAESVLGRSLVEGSAPSSWKSMQSGAYDWTRSCWIELDSGGWVAASEEIVAYYLDPRNFLDSDGVFQFLSQSYDASVQTAEGLALLTEGTFLADTGKNIDPESGDGGKTYASALLEAGERFGVSPYILASMMVQEMGRSGASQSISGTNAKFPGYYNAFNIGAYKTAELTAVERGLWYASGGTNGVGTSYGRPWTTLYRAILGGTQFYAENYVQRGQTTLYLKRFNVQGASPFTNQYMTNVGGAYSEGKLLSEAYSDAMRSRPLSFSIPIYENMPSVPCPKPGADGGANARLQSIRLSAGTLSPEFHRDVRSYTVIVPIETERLTIEATPIDASARVEGGGELALSPGVNRVELRSLAPNGTQEIYSIEIVRRSEDAPAVPAPAAPTPATTPTPTPISVSTPTPAPTLQRGDVDGDGSVNIRDLIRLRNHLLGTAELTGASHTAADVNADSTVSIHDLIRMRNYLLGTADIIP